MMTKALAKDIHAEIDEAVAAVARKHGLSAKKHGGRYTSSSWSARIELVELTEPGAETPEAQDYLKKAELYGLKADWLGKSFIGSKGRSFRIVGLKPKASKYPVLGEDQSTGRRFKFGADYVRLKMEA